MEPELAKLYFGTIGEVNQVPGFYFRGNMIGEGECRLLLFIYDEFKNDRETVLKISNSVVKTAFRLSDVSRISVALERVGDLRGEALLKLGFVENRDNSKNLGGKVFVCLREEFKHIDK